MMGPSESLAQLLQFSVMPIAKVLVMCSLGLLMATRRVNILSESSSRKGLSKLVFSLFLPCLIFTQLGSAVTLGKMIRWWFVPVNIVISACLGCLVGLVVALIFRPQPQFFKFTIVMVGIGNIGNIPLVLIDAVCRDQNNPFGDPQQCDTNGVAYISYGQWVGAVIVYTFVFQMLSPPMKPANELYNIDDTVVLKIDTTDGPPELTPLLSDASRQQDSEYQLYTQVSGEKKVLKTLKLWLKKSRIQDILQPPVAASILALVVGAIPFLKMLFFKQQAVFFFLSDSMNLMGGAMIPCIMLVLGAGLVKGPGTSELGTRTTVAIVLTRLFLVPLIGLLVVSMADKFGLLPRNDKMFRFVLLLQHSMPTSILAGLKIYGVTEILAF
ncbi:hypothetical protein O6H91_10G020400 [Diphasiastrum complanatum]|uniref:Uncharacterized protein n=1 Tax=Diphasiastrum complanatum TaxID=34168 RepID=A0ACC2CEQ2_DIPCM|nr:hypothetical protein O6H91_10G020400 [Diphasiastrum complanatum]